MAFLCRHLQEIQHTVFCSVTYSRTVGSHAQINLFLEAVGLECFRDAQDGLSRINVDLV